MQNTEHTSENQVSRSNASVQNRATVGFASVPPVGLKAAETEEQKAEPVQLQKAHQFSTGGYPVAPPKPNNTGLPDNLKSGMESLSGYSLDDVSVHYNSSRPAQLQAHAFAQGTDIHIAPGQEKHLAHEAWHVVQQKQNRVRPTMQLKEVSVNDDAGLEHEADVMGTKALSVTQPFQAKALQQGSSGTTVQGQWIHLLPSDKFSQEERELLTQQAKQNPVQGFIQMLLKLHQKGETAYDDKLDFLINQVQWTENLTQAANMAIGDTIDTQAYYSNNYLFEQIENTLLENIVEVEHEEEHVAERFSEVADDDHGAVDEGADVEKTVDWNDIDNPGALHEAIDTDGVPLLYHIFVNLVQYHCLKAGKQVPGNLQQGYQIWVNGGVHTRAQFKKLLGIGTSEEDETNNIIQMARTPNTYSYNTDYDGASNSFEYKNVIYYRDGGGNIDFSVDPKTIIAKYNKAEGQKLKVNQIKWKYPQKDASKINMNKGMKNKEEGVMPSGKKVKLKSASRGQHFAIADALYKNQRAGTWTWHHLTPRYQMILVDMTVHAKHGHNGGVHLWK